MARAAAAPARAAPVRPAPARPPARAPRRGPAEAPRRPAARPPRGAAVLDALLHGRVWIAIVFMLLAGIVFFNVDLLRMNREIAVAAEQASAVKRENARLRTDLARLGSSERIQRVAAERGLVLPAPGEVRYLRSDPAVDARNAAKRMAAVAAPGSQPGAPAEAPGTPPGEPAETQRPVSPSGPAPELAASETQPRE